jgi:hypothetical protein
VKPPATTALAIRPCFALGGLACLAFIVLAVIAILVPEPVCRPVCVKDHTEIRTTMRVEGNGYMAPEVTPVSVCDEYQEVCRPDAAEPLQQDMAASARNVGLLNDEAMAERIKRAADRDDARSVERRCGKNFGADLNGAPRRPRSVSVTSPEMGGDPPLPWPVEGALR